MPASVTRAASIRLASCANAGVNPAVALETIAAAAKEISLCICYVSLRIFLDT